jgi:hypothetical protein
MIPSPKGSAMPYKSGIICFLLCLVPWALVIWLAWNRI